MPKSISLPRPSDRWIPYYFFAFFTLLVLVLVPMCVLAFRTSTGVVTEHAYEKGLAYNDSIRKAERQKALGWHAELDVHPVAANRIGARFALRDGGGAPLDGAVVTLWLVRPTQGGMDQKMQMTPAGNGRYEASVALPLTGLWEARVSATSRNNNYQMARRVILP
ncbi:MAG: FixH family protein [Bdellovibrionales bacterium]